MGLWTSGSTIARISSSMAFGSPYASPGDEVNAGRLVFCDTEARARAAGPGARATRAGESRVFLTAYGQTAETDHTDCARWVGLSGRDQGQRHRPGAEAELRPAAGAVSEHPDSHLGAVGRAAGRADGQ